MRPPPDKPASTLDTSIATQQADEVGSRPELKRGAIGYLSNIVIGVASTAPAYSLAATVGFFILISGIGLKSPAVIIVSFIPMMCIAWAHKAMNAVDPDCGTSFSWISRAMGPGLGWVIGWTVLFSDLVVPANQRLPSHLESADWYRGESGGAIEHRRAGRGGDGQSDSQRGPAA